MMALAGQILAAALGLILLRFLWQAEPTTANVCTVYCGEVAMRGHLELLDRVAEVLMEGGNLNGRAG